MTTKNKSKLTVFLAVFAALALLPRTCDAIFVELVAYYPVESATDTSLFLDDVIDDASHGAADGTSASGAASIIFDATRGGDVVSTVQGHRYTAGFQDSDLSKGFTWSLWVKSDSVANADAGADVIIGSRNGIWNKVQPTGTARWFDLGYNINDDTWHHIAYTGDSANGGEFWIDGVSVATDSTPFGGIQIENIKLEIGGASQFTEDWTGLIDEVSIWRDRLPDSKIQQLFNGDSVFLVIPEPSTFALALFALLGLIGAVRRRR